MGTIAFFADFEEGHLLSTMKLAKQLRTRGHRVLYLGLADIEPLVRAEEFEFITIFAELMPAGFRDRTRRTAATRTIERLDRIQDLYFEPLVTGRLLDEVVSRVRPDVLLINSLFPTEALAVQYRYSLSVALYRSAYLVESRSSRAQKVVKDLLTRKCGVDEMIQLIARSGASVRGLRDISALILQLPELVFLPRAFDLAGRSEPNSFYIGAAVDLNRAEEPFVWDKFDSDRHLIYCSLGSQSDLSPEISRRFFHNAIDAVRDSAVWQMIITAGRAANLDEFADAPNHVTVLNWVPQIQTLRRTALMINHGGLGTIRECILLGVPMIVCPLMRDQFDGAEAVERHGLGIRLDVQASAEELNEAIKTVFEDASYRSRINHMRREFESESSPSGVEVVEQLMATSVASNGR